MIAMPMSIDLSGPAPTGVPGSISVVIVTKDRREQLLETLQRLDGLPERPPVILVDNGSTDGTAAAVERCFPKVTVLRPGRNLGAAGRNLGVRAAGTKYVAFADDDSWWAPGALTRAVRHLEAHPQIGLLAARTLVGPEHRLDPVCSRMAASPLGAEKGLPGPSVLGFLACAAVVRRSAFLQVGGFTPLVVFFGEETLLAQDLAAAGWSLVYADDIVAHHHPTAAGDRPDRTRLAVRNELLSTWLRRPATVAVARSIATLCRARDQRVRGALGDVLRHLPAVFRQRRVLPRELERRVRLVERADGLAG